jgi:tryptophan-rich sensory protein
MPTLVGLLGTCVAIVRAVGCHVAWVAFATVLNVAIWRLNPRSESIFADI